MDNDEPDDDLAQLRAELVALGTRLVRLQEVTTATESDLLAIEAAALVIATRVQGSSPMRMWAWPISASK